MASHRAPRRSNAVTRLACRVHAALTTPAPSARAELTFNIAEDQPELVDEPTTAELPPEAVSPAVELTAPLKHTRATPTDPTHVLLAYPDGREVPAGWAYDGRAGAANRWVALVPEDAPLANGMVVRVHRDLVLAVAVKDRPAVWAGAHP